MILARAWSYWLIAGALLITPATAIAAAGSVVGVNGACTIESGGKAAPAKIGQPVEVGDSIVVPADGKVKLRLNDGSIVSVAAGSRMTIAAFTTDASGQRQDAKLALGQGLIRAVTAPVGRVASFEVDTAVGTAAARSTDWFVESAANSMQVGVLTGSIDMTSRATRRPVTIPSRWGARLEAGRDPVPPRVWSQAEFDAVIQRTDVR